MNIQVQAEACVIVIIKLPIRTNFGMDVCVYGAFRAVWALSLHTVPLQLMELGG